MEELEVPQTRFWRVLSSVVAIRGAVAKIAVYAKRDSETNGRA
jgi:hypothetical protein